jgi:predicted ArsR family transcriptional regulator
MKDRLLEMLKAASRERPLDRYEAATELFISEREVRRLIAELREQGVRVCSDSRGRGYWVARDEHDYKQFRAEYVSRATKIFKAVRAMDGVVEGQIGGLV